MNDWIYALRETLGKANGSGSIAQTLLEQIQQRTGARVVRLTLAKPAEMIAEVVAQDGEAVDLPAHTFPLYMTGQHVGTLSIAPPPDLRAEEVALLSMLAGLVIQALPQVQEPAIAASINQLATLSAIGNVMTSSLEPDVVLENTLTRIMDSLNADFGAVYLTQPRRERLKIRVCQGITEEARQLIETLPLNDPVVEDVLREYIPLVNGDISQGEWDKQAAPLAKANAIIQTRAIVLAPILFGDNPLGMIGLGSRNADHFTEDDGRLLAAIGRQLALSIDNARLYRRMRERADRLDALNHASEKISGSLDRDVVLENIVRETPNVLGVDGAVVCKCPLPPASAIIEAKYIPPQAGLNLPETGSLCIINRLPPVSRALLGRRPCIMHADDPGLDGASRAYLERTGAKRILWLPLTIRGEVSGLLGAFEVMAEQEPDMENAALGVTLANQAAVALEQADLFAELQALERVKSDMLRMASHDIGRPLNEIIQMLELMTDFDLTEEEHRQYVRTIRRAAQNIDDIISDLIAFDRVESEVGTRFERASAAEMIHEAIEDLEGAIKMKGHAFTDEIAGDLPILYANRLHIRRAMENLLSNAIKYTPDGGRIVLRARIEGERFIFEVEDNGYGIPANKMHRLYERFGRLKQPGTGHIPGTGLGLSLVKTVVEAHGGEPYISSVDGEGTISGFWLPIKEES